MERREIEEKLQKELDKERYQHTVGVMYTAATLAMVHDCDITQAIYAGLLHDCAKCIPTEQMIPMCKKYRIEISPSEQKSPFLLHAKLGAYLAREEYGITDPDILHAIRVHTTGKPGMNLLDKIIYIADYIEPGRDKAPNLNRIRKMAYQDLNQTMLLILEDTLSYLNTKNNEIDPLTLQTYEFFKEQTI